MHYVPHVAFSLHLQAVLSLNFSFASPVTFQTSRWHPLKGLCWAGLAAKHLPLVSSAIPSASVSAGLCTPWQHPLMCAWEKMSTESTELTKKCLDDSFLVFAPSVLFRCLLWIQQKGRNKIPPFLQFHQDVYFPSGKNTTMGKKMGVGWLKKESSHWKIVILQWQQVLGW